MLANELGSTRIEVLDITHDERLENEYVFRIPVVLHEGEVIAEGIIGRNEARNVRRHLATSRAESRQAT